MSKAGEEIKTDAAGTTSAVELPFEPSPAFISSPLQNDAVLARCEGKRIGILIVTYNAVTTLTKVLKRITPNVWANVEEIAIFDDASADATYELAVGVATLRKLPKLTVVKHEKNLGYGGNQKAGYRYFTEKGFDIVVLLHGDGQYAPEILSHVYHPLVTGEADAVFGSRMMKTYGGALQGGMPFYKYIGNRILSTFENRALGMNLTEFHSGYRAYNLHALKQINFAHMTNDFHFDTEIIIKLHHQGYRIKEVPIPTYYGTEICYVKGLQYARDVFRAVRRYKRTCRSVARYPEFEEYFIRYPVKKTPGSSHDHSRRMVGTNHDVLYVGCGSGAFAAELKANGSRVIGVDRPETAVTPEALSRYIPTDLDRGLAPVIQQAGQRFERVLLIDILEHLKCPEAVLGDCHQLLAGNGRAIVSLPNVANIAVRLPLLFGQFHYSERGILDRTHLRFYTRKTARRLLEENGFEIVAEKPTVIPLELVLGWAPESFAFRVLNSMLRLCAAILPGLFAYETVFLVKSAQH